jgi:FkbM family methyltransferase
MLVWAGAARRLPLLDNVIRALGTTALARAVMRWPAIKDPIRFNAAELVGSRGRVQVHQVQGGSVVLRHRTRDTDIFDEIFVGNLAYQPPPALAAQLDAHPPQRVLDLGANIGLFGVYALACWPAATITSVEPDPANLPLLARCVEVNDGANGWRVIAACAASRPGTVAFSGSRFADSALALDGEIVTAHVAAVDALELLAQADFAKIDIEGGEWDVLLDPRFATVAPAVVVIEWHQRGCPAPDAYVTALDAFRDAGYEVEAQPPPPHEHYGTMWAWRSAPPQ